MIRQGHWQPSVGHDSASPASSQTLPVLLARGPYPVWCCSRHFSVLSSSDPSTALNTLITYSFQNSLLDPLIWFFFHLSDRGGGLFCSGSNSLLFIKCWDSPGLPPRPIPTTAPVHGLWLDNDKSFLTASPALSRLPVKAILQNDSPPKPDPSVSPLLRTMMWFPRASGIKALLAQDPTFSAFKLTRL